MTPTAGDKARAAIQRRKDRLRRKKHAVAQSEYRQRRVYIKGSGDGSDSARDRNADALREKARQAMRKHRAAIKQSEERTKAMREQRREVDAEYRERQRQKHWIKKFGQESFEEIYVPLSRIHGTNTSKLHFVRGPPILQAEDEARAKDGKV